MDNMQRGITEDLSEEDNEELEAIAERRVRLGLVLSEIGNENNIKVADNELQHAVISEAQKYPGQEKDVFDYFAKNREALESLRAPIFEDKVVDFILELSDVKEKEVSVEELTAEDSEFPKKESKKKKSSEEKKSSTKKASAKKAPAKKTKAKKAS